MNVPDTYGLKLILHTPNGNQRIIWRRYGFQNDVWYLENLYIQLKAGDKLSFVGSTTSGTVALGRMYLNPGTDENCKHQNFNTDFEDDVSDWNSNNVVISDVSPYLTDHTSNSPNGKVAHLLINSISTRRFVNPAAKCFEFWYNRPSLSKNSRETGFSVLVNQGRKWSVNEETTLNDNWYRAQIPLNISGTGNRIEIVSDAVAHIVNPGVFLDDFKFLDTPCAMAVECSFQDTTCGWTHKLKTNYDHRWIVGSGRAAESETFKDKIIPHKFPSHLYIDFSREIDPQGVKIVSDFLPSDDEYCVQMTVYHNALRSTDELTLSQISQRNFFSEEKTVWRLNDDTTDASPNVYIERKYEIQIAATNISRRLGLLAKSSNRATRYGISDLKVQQGKCQPPPTTEAPTLAPDFIKSKLDKSILIVADELMKNTKTNMEEILTHIKFDDPIKVATHDVLRKLFSAIELIEKNLK